MIAFATVKYTQTFFPSKRCKKLRTRTLTKECKVHIKEVSDKEFPVAFKVRTFASVLPKCSSFNQAWEICGDGAKSRYFTETVRKLGKKFFRPVRYAFGSAFSVSMAKTTDAIVRKLSNWQYFGYNESYEFNPDTAIVVNDNFKTHFKELKKFTSQFVVFKNTLWEETPEPLYTYTTFGLGNNHGGTGFFINYGKRCNASRKIYWTADQRDQAIKAAVEAALDRGDTESVKWIRNAKENIEVVNG